MDHIEASEALWELYDGELAPEKRGAVETHAAQCAECRQTLESWRGAASAFFPKAGQPPAARTEAFVYTVMSRVREEEERAPLAAFSRLLSPRWLVPTLAGLAAASLLAVPGLRGVPDPAETIILGQKGGESFLSFINGSAPSSHDEVLSFVQGER